MKTDALTEKILDKIDQLEQIIENLVRSFQSVHKLDTKQTFTERETSEILKISVRTLNSHRQNGLIDFHKNGRRILYTQKNIDDYLVRGKKKAYQFK